MATVVDATHFEDPRKTIIERNQYNNFDKNSIQTDEIIEIDNQDKPVVSKVKVSNLSLW